MSESEVLLRVEGLNIAARQGGVRRVIASDIDLSLRRGETIGIVGESGSGKSMMARAIVGLLPRGVESSGTVEYQGRNLIGQPERALRRIRGSEIGLVFQDPFTMLNPVRRCGRHVDEQLRGPSGRRLSRRQRNQEAVRRFAEVGITAPNVTKRFPFELSGGMRQRVGIAAALAQDPTILIADEPSTALDVTTQKQILDLLKSLQESRGMALILITHDLRVAFSMCDRIYVMYAGQILEVGPAALLRREPRHPYTLGLLMSDPPVEAKMASLASIPGSVPPADSVLESCGFASRCKWAEPRCSATRPTLRLVSDDRRSACLRVDEIRGALAGEQVARSSLVANVVAESPPADALLEGRDVRKVFAAGRDETVALGGVSLFVRRGESVGLVGESGSGKTTFGRCVVGLEMVTSGSIIVDGIDATNLSLSDADRRRLRHKVQFIFQDPYSSLNPARTVGFALAEAVRVKDSRRRKVNEAVDHLLHRVGLPSEYAQRKPVALSGGERQRVAIARALAVDPELLICDEPVSALDVSVQAQILNLFGELREELGVSYLFISHDLAVVRQIADRAYVLFKGEIVESGAVGQILDAPNHPYTKALVDAIPRIGDGSSNRTGDVAAVAD